MGSAEKFKNIVTEIDNGETDNWADFIEYAYDVCRHERNFYQARIIESYQFGNQACNNALLWIRDLLDRRPFGKELVLSCINSGQLGSIHWCWKYVFGLGDGIPVDCTMISFEAPDSLHIWAEYSEDPDLQPLGPFAKFDYNSLNFQLSHSQDRFLIFSLTGHDLISEADLKLDFRVYTDQSTDADGRYNYSDEKALIMANEYYTLINRLKFQYGNKPDLLSQEELDKLLMAVTDGVEE